MFCSTGEVGNVNLVSPPPSYSLLTVLGRCYVVVHCCLFFGVRVPLTFYLMCVQIIFSSVLVAEWPYFGKELLPRLTICSLCTLTICNFSYLPFRF